MQSPIYRIVMGIVGVVMLIVGISQMMNGFKELNSNGLPDEKKRASAIEKSLASMAEFTEPGGAFSMSYPTNWERNEKLEAPQILNIQDFKGVVSLSVSSEEEPKEVTTAQYAKLTDETIAKVVAADAISDVLETDISLNGTPAKKRTHLIASGSGKDKINVKQVMILAAKNGRGYCITGSALQDWFPQFEPLFNKMIESIKIKD